MLRGDSSLPNRWRRLRKVIRNEGYLISIEAATFWLASRVFGDSPVYHSHAAIAGKLFDLRRGTSTSGVIQLRSLGLDSSLGHHYIATVPHTLRKVLAHLPINPSEFTFVDLGCGKGRALLVAREVGFRRLIGVDISRSLLEIARSNLRERAQLVEMNAAEFVFPAEPLVVYLFNPFHMDLALEIVRKLELSLLSNLRKVYVVYNRPSLKQVVSDSPAFRLLVESDLKYPWYAIFESVEDGVHSQHRLV